MLTSSHLCNQTNQVGLFADSLSCLRPRPYRLLINRRVINLSSYFNNKLFESRIRKNGRPRVLQVCVYAMDEDSVGVSSLHDWGDENSPVEFMFSSSEGEDSDGEIILQPITDVDLPISKERLLPADDSLAVTAHRLAMLRRVQKKRKTAYGILNNVGLITFSILLLLTVDQCAWRIVRLPLAPFHLMRPFLVAAVVVSCAGYICVPLFDIFRIRSVIRKEVHTQRSLKRGTPTMGGLYFIPIGLLVAEVILGFSSVEVSGATAATMAFAAIGLLDDFLRLKNYKSPVSCWIRILMEVAVGTWFSYWLHTTNISTPYGMKMVVPLPMGLFCVRKFYPVLTSVCFVSMANGIDLTDGLDGLSAGTAALAFIGMSIVVLPICSDLAVFGTSMAGACVGFLLQNRYRASVFMGDTGSLALGGALAAMASCTGMFFPLFISSGILILEAISVIIRVCFFKGTRYFQQTNDQWIQMATFHHHLEVCGIKEPIIVAGAYVVTSLLILCAAYVGLTSA